MEKLFKNSIEAEIKFEVDTEEIIKEATIIAKPSSRTAPKMFWECKVIDNICIYRTKENDLKEIGIYRIQLKVKCASGLETYGDIKEFVVLDTL